MDLDAIIKRAKEKDPKALDIIYRTYYPQMAGTCMNITREDKSTVDDLVHDAFILAFVSIGSLRDNSRLNEWLTTIVRNVALKHVKQRAKVQILPISSIKDEDAVLADSSLSPDTEFSHKELLRLIDQLPEGYSKVLRLSVVEGFSHKEIASMLGIEPHTSSSQLSRAKRFLKRLVDNRAIGVISLLLLPLAWYLISRHEGKQQDDMVEVKTKQEEQTKPESDKSVAERNDGLEEEKAPYDSALKRAETAQDITPHNTVLPPADSVSVGIDHRTAVDEEIMIAEAQEDSLDAIVKDSVVKAVIQPEINISEESGGKKEQWQLLAAGSLGPALAQSVYKMIAANASDGSSIGSEAPEPEGPTYILPESITTWEDYSKYLRLMASSDVSADTLALMEIADHNTGEIEQREHHDKPITFSVSLTKALGGKWSLGTGLQYSILQSRFTMGEKGYAVVDRQKAHYLGIPLSVSYNWMDYKRLSAYSSVGVTMHIPVYGKIKTDYLVDWQSAYSKSQHFTPSLQWQTGVSIGLQYKLGTHASVFAEPTLNWFIPLGSETRTIWTEQPFELTCPFGVRISW